MKCQGVRRQKSTNGFSLLEVLVSIIFITVLVVTILQCMTYCLRTTKQAHEYWQDSLLKWNKVQELRSLPAVGGYPVIVLPGARPMTYREVRSTLETGHNHWKVLSAAK